MSAVRKRLDATTRKLREQIDREIDALFLNFTDEELIALARGDPVLFQRAVDLGAQVLFERALALMTPEERGRIPSAVETPREIEEFEK